LWPKIEHPSDGLMLAASHAIGSNALIEEEVATFLADLLLSRYAQLITARYGFPTADIDGVSVVEGIARRRGYRSKGGELDLEKAAHTLLQDYRSGALGRISLETPESRIALLASYRPPPALGEPQDVVGEFGND
jgi:ribosome biogenesis GTPase A